ncbi:MAG TPA: hypothetical protein VJ818_07500 [Actinomycetota bacterium]|nr:hypothetical protein [Actinomycetota bacterium]
MKRAFGRGALVGAFVVLSLALGAHAAGAQVPPLPPIPEPTLPPQVQPVFELLAPTLYPQCGTAALGMILAGQEAPQLGPDLFTLGAPIFVVCGSVPRPGTQLQCLLDAQQQAALAAVIAQAGAALPLGLHPEGDVVEQTLVVEDQLPAQVKALGAGKAVSSILGCAPITESTNPQGDYATTPGFQTPSVSGYTLTPSAPTAAIAFPSTVPQRSTAPFATIAPARATPAGEAVRYAVVWLLPLALLSFGGYFGGALTRDVEPAVFRS